MPTPGSNFEWRMLSRCSKDGTRRSEKAYLAFYEVLADVVASSSLCETPQPEHRSMLPDGFYWTTWTIDAVALKFGEHLIGLVVGGCANGQCRVERNVGTLHTRYEFFSHPDVGVRFLEAWARRWEPRIREQYGSIGSADYGSPRTPHAPSVQTSHRRSARRPRVL